MEGETKMRTCTWPAALAAMILCLGASADPMGSVEGGGSVRLAAEHPTISLDRERLVFEALPRVVRISAELEFRNHSGTCDVPMQFPVLLWHPGSGQDPVRGELDVKVDGVSLAVTKEEGWLELQSGKLRCAWHKFTVPFSAGATRQMTVQYEQSSQQWAQVPYVLATGGTWKDSIREFQLEVRLGERLNFHELQLTGDHQPLPYEETGGTLVWRCTDYDGKPEVLWFRAYRGPAWVAIDDGRPMEHSYSWSAEGLTGDTTLSSSYTGFMWHEGRLLVEHGILGQITMARLRRAEDGTTQATRDGRTVELESVSLPVGRSENGKVRYWRYCDPGPALAAFGGGIEHGLTDQGDLWVSVTSAPDSGDSAGRTALCAEQKWEYRLRCLRALAAKWPADLPEVCRELCAREREHPVVLLAVLGHLADDPPDFATPENILPRLDVRGDKGRIDALTSQYVLTRDDFVARGRALALAALDPAGARERIIEMVAARRVTQPEGLRNMGLALRAVRAPDTCRVLIDTIKRCTDGRDAYWGMTLLGYLGDNEALPFLTRVAGGDHPWDRHSSAHAATAMALIGIPEALGACADLAAERRSDYWIASAALGGLERALGMPPGRYDRHLALPSWARALSVEEARRVARPLTERLRTALPSKYEKRLAAILDQTQQTASADAW